jgi:hypothetical protein
MEPDLTEGEKRLPLRVQGHVFHQAIQQSSNRYVVALVDPAWLDPAERTAVIRLQVAGVWCQVAEWVGVGLGVADSFTPPLVSRSDTPPRTRNL